VKDMADDGPEFNGQGKRPWFGPKRFGYGTRPQTWQGYLVVALALVPLIVVAALTGGHSAWTVLGAIPLVLVGVFARTMRSRR
jgi:hypothetical protein